MLSLENSPESRDRFWGKALRFPGDYAVETCYRKAVYFSAINKLLRSIPFSGKDIIELGSGTGNNSLYIARKYRAHSVTLVDFSPSALKHVVRERYPCPVRTVQSDIFEFEPSESYDCAISFGLVEHFAGEQRLEVVRKHAECVKPGGFVMMWVPVYSSALKVVGAFNRMLGIQEIPFTKDELRTLCVRSGLAIVKEGSAAFGALYGVLAQKSS